MTSTGSRGLATQRPRHEAPQPPRRRRLMLRSLLRSLLTTTALVVLYYLLPLDRKIDPATGVTLAFGLLAFVGVICLQVWQITRSSYPRLRALETLIVSPPLLILIFAVAYFTLAHGDAEAFTQPLTRTDALYFTITVFTTVGFGDIAPRTETARIIAMIQMIGDVVVVGVIARIILSAVTTGLRRRSTKQTPSDRESVDGDQ